MAESQLSRSELDVLRRQAQKAWDWFEEEVHDITAEQANWWPPGTANSIGATYLHVVINTDVELSRLLFGEEPLVETSWDGDVGQNVPYDPERFDRWDRHIDIDWEKLRSYGRAVRATLLDSLAHLTPEHLDQPVDMTRAGLGMWQGRDLFELHGSNHVHIHGGEIACLKGLQGGVGWQESDAFRAAVIVEDHRA
jgi:DinB superfamily